MSALDPVALDRRQLAAEGRMAAARGSLEDLRNTLERAPRWRPSRTLLAQCEAAAARIDALQARMRRKLVVALVGPTGAGKSTLLNALAGVDGLSQSGAARPTTREVVVYCQDPEDADPLRERLGDAHVRVASSHAAALEYVILVDTPDINSGALAAHRPIVEGAIGVADVLVTVFGAENPKSRDSVDFLAPFVAGFPGTAVLTVLNQCDRQDEGELRRDILPDFARHLEGAWSRPPSRVFCVSARKNLRRPAWPPGAEPRHDFDEFDALREALLGSLNRASVVVDVRVSRARHLAEAVWEAASEAAAAARAPVVRARKAKRSLEREALKDAATALDQHQSGLSAGVDAMFYQRLAGAWWGPVGWLVGLWARLLLVGAGVANILRFGKPLRQLWGMVTSLARFKESRAERVDAEQGAGLEAAALRYRQRYAATWPDIAEALVEAGFDEAVRDPAAVAAPTAQLETTLTAGWSEALEAELRRATGWLSSFPLQLFLNAWVLVPAVAVAVRAIGGFFGGELLTGDYFRHAFFTLFVLWLLAFVVLQIGARALGGQRLLRAALRRLLAAMDGADAPAHEHALSLSLTAVERLAARRAVAPPAAGTTSPEG